MTRKVKLVWFQIGQRDPICHRLKCIYIIAKWIIMEAEVIEWSNLEKSGYLKQIW